MGIGRLSRYSLNDLDVSWLKYRLIVGTQKPSTLTRLVKSVGHSEGLWIRRGWHAREVRPTYLYRDHDCWWLLSMERDSCIMQRSLTRKTILINGCEPEGNGGREGSKSMLGKRRHLRKFKISIVIVQQGLHMNLFETILNKVLTNVLNEEEIIKRYKGDVRLIAKRLYEKTLEAIKAYRPDDSYNLALLYDRLKALKPPDDCMSSFYVEMFRDGSGKFYKNPCSAAVALQHMYRRKEAHEIINNYGGRGSTAWAFYKLAFEAFRKNEKKWDEKTKSEFFKYSFISFVFLLLYAHIKNSIRDSETGEREKNINNKGNFEQLYERIVHIKDLKIKFLYLSQLITKYGRLLEQKNAKIDITPALQVLKARDVELLAKNLDKIPKKDIKDETFAKIKEDIEEYYNYLITKYYKEKTPPPAAQE